MFKTMFFFSVQGSRHTWTLKKNIVLNMFLSCHSIIPPPCWLSCWLSCWLLCCCHVVVVVFVYFVATLPTPPPPPPSACRRHRHCHQPVWRLTPATQKPTAALPRCCKLSDGKLSGTKIQHGLRRPPNTNKNATTNQKHVGLTRKR
jgi:hypothetical protein